MLYIALVLLIIAAFSSIRLFYVERQIKNLTEQLTDIHKNNIDKKLTIGLLNKNIEVLAGKINEVIQSKKQSEANKVKLEKHLRQTIANMSHDLRTPLTSIIGYIQFLKFDDIAAAEKKEYLSIALDRALALESLLNDFYELSLIESLDYELNLQKLNINKILQEVVLGKYADFMNLNIEPKLDIPKENVYIIADEKSLNRVIENLLGNSVKYAKDTVSIYLKVEKNKVLLKISNTVENLSSSDIEHIFDRFYMADKTRSSKGTGLGLAIAKSLVEKMNGSILAGLDKDIFSICCWFQGLP